MAGYCKYYKQKKQVSYDNGVTFQDVIPYEYQKGDLYEADSNDCGYIPPIPPSPTGSSGQYLTFMAIDSGTFKFTGSKTQSTATTGNTLSYSLDNGNTWTELDYNTYTPTIASGSTIMWKGSGLHINYAAGIGQFYSTGRFYAYNNIMSLVSGDSFIQASIAVSAVFTHLFNYCVKLIGVENLILPATNAGQYCYYGMFANCTNLTSVPQIHATSLGHQCCDRMFSGCTSLTTVPSNMLPATTLATSCYHDMFANCTSITTAPDLPATTLAGGCYNGMFSGCTSLTTAPDLPATTLAIDCYRNMFGNCTSLTAAPVLSAATLDTRCYREMFSGCTSLNSITCLASNFGNYSTYNWLIDVSSTGTFTKTSGVTWETGASGIPNGWTVIDV